MFLQKQKGFGQWNFSLTSFHIQNHIGTASRAGGIRRCAPVGALVTIHCTTESEAGGGHWAPTVFGGGPHHNGL